MKFLKRLHPLCILLFLNSCSTLKEHSMNIKHLPQLDNEKKQALYYADFDATKRGALIIHEKEVVAEKNSTKSKNLFAF